MRRFQFIFVCLLAVALGGQAMAGSGKIRKFLPHYLDKEGRHTTSPSLYERDAYQDFLRKNPEEISGMRFDVRWSASGTDREQLKIRVEIRGSKTLPGKPFVIERTPKSRGLFGKWEKIQLTDDRYKQIGKIIAWRVTLLEGSQELSSMESFLWSAEVKQKVTTANEKNKPE